MAGATVSLLDYLLKEYYDPEGIAEQINNETILSKRVPIATETFDGRRFFFAIETGYSEAVGTVPESAPLPAPGNRTGVDATVYPMFTYATVQLSGPAVEQAKSNKGAFADAMDREVNGMVTNVAMHMNRIRFNDGTGAMGQVASVAGNVITMTQGTNMVYFRPNQVLSVITGPNRTGALRTGTMTVQSVDPINFNITVNAVVTGTSANDWLMLANNQQNPNTNLFEAMGLLGVVDDGTYAATLQGVSRTSYPIWKANVLNAGTASANADLTLRLLRQAFTRARIYGKSEPDLILSTDGVRDAYIGLIEPDRRYVDTYEIDGGFEAVAYSNGGKKIDWVTDKDCPLNTVFILNTKDLRNFYVFKGRWDDTTGSIWKQAQVSGAYVDAYWAYWKAYWNFGAKRCNTHAVIRYVNEVQ